jgi:hypothetical protein
MFLLTPAGIFVKRKEGGVKPWRFAQQKLTQVVQKQKGTAIAPSLRIFRPFEEGLRRLREWLPDSGLLPQGR